MTFKQLDTEYSFWGADKVAPWEKGLAAKLDKQSSILGTHVVEDNQLLQAAIWSHTCITAWVQLNLPPQ